MHWMDAATVVGLLAVVWRSVESVELSVKLKGPRAE
jgi:hypothetical protein